MNDELELELERYELFAGLSYHFPLNRRQFLKAFSGGIALIVPMSNLIARTVQQEQDELKCLRTSSSFSAANARLWLHTRSNCPKSQ